VLPAAVDFREQILRRCGADAAQTAELLAYCENRFDHTTLPVDLTFPLAAEPHALAWQQYAEGARTRGAFAELSSRLVQFSFPIAAGISADEQYRAATLRGAPVAGSAVASGLRLTRPDELQIIIHPSAAGPVAMLAPAGREDFVTLVQALTRRNEPDAIPDSMGACMVAGYNNWDRIRQHRLAWTAANGEAASDDAWRDEFRRLTAERARYQDRFIIISDGPYSNVAASEMDCDEATWRRLSLQIRVEHESVHYFTRRILDASHNNLFDEIIADYVGIVAVAGRFRADWFLRFAGLEAAAGYRRGGRLENYRGTPPLTDGAFAVLQLLVRAAAGALERFDARFADESREMRTQALLLLALTRLTLEELAADEGDNLLERAWMSVQEAAVHVPS
jgi:hypothetical protein